MQQKYETEILERKAALAGLSKTSNIIGVFKVIWILMCTVTIYHIWTYHFPLYLVALFIAELIIYIIACFYHESLLNRTGREAGLIEIAEENIKRITGNWISFMDIGEEFIDYNHDYSSDLDIVGKHSLFQYLNSTNTYYGRNQFAQDLLNPHFSHEDILARQEAISELSSDYAWTSQIEYSLSKIGIDQNFPFLLSKLQDPKPFVKSTLVKGLLNLSRILTLVSILGTLLTRDGAVAAAAGILMLLQFFLWSIGYSRVSRYLGIMLKLPYKIAYYSDAIKDITAHNFEAQKLKEIQSVLSSAEEAMRSFSKIAGNISQAKNEVVRMILNTLFLWDYKNAVDLDNWKQKYGPFVKHWFITLGELESLISFSNLPRSLSTACTPTLSSRPDFLRAEDLGHPLLSNSKRVCNDITLDNQIMIISGSNMSGKTTFMRTVGINIILANAGSYVCAGQMTYSPMKVITSMRIADELTEGISTFYAELKRIKKIIDAAKTGTCQLFLIDEIFRGTNSTDRLKGAEEVLKKLCTLGISGMITTHDLEVCKLASVYERILNYSFYEHYTDGEIYFDYKIKNGVSKTTNAEFLLRKIGII